MSVRQRRSALMYLMASVLMLLNACKKNNAVFESLPASSTHIQFANKLHKAELFSILYYLYYYNGAGVAVGDVNNDGLSDIYFTANNPGGNKLYLNKGNFEFEDITTKAAVAGKADWCTGATMADINGDGFLDIYVCAASNTYGLKGSNELFINNGNLTFTASAAAYGLNFSGLSTQAAFFDYDHDGDLDCYLLNHSKKPHANVVDTINRRKVDPLFGDKLYRNDVVNGAMKFTDVAAQAGIYQSSLGYGLGLAIADFNNDGWEDIYVGNDFHENDYYYINNANGTFTESGAEHFRHYSRFSMGNDAADYNNDGNVDVITVDMLPPDEKTMKTYGSDENPNVYKAKVMINGYQHQFSRNSLQRNNGDGVSFSETALMNGVPATDWSWSPLFADFDNDGNKDLFVSSGIVKRPVDLDYVQFVSAMQAQKNLDITDDFDDETIAKMPDGSSHPFFFKGKGDEGFTDVSEAWGTQQMKGYFNGATYADLNNDGNLDMVINCIDQPAVILKNNAPVKKHLTISFKGAGQNTFGMGAKAYVFANGKMQFQQLMTTRGFQSSTETRLHFGLDSATTVDSVLIVWPNQQYQVMKNVPTNKGLLVDAKDASGQFEHSKYFPSQPPVWSDVTLQSGINYRHTENNFLDFNRQYLIPHAQSTRGPKIAVADVNNDGLEDFYVCGAHTQSGALFLQKAGGKFAVQAIDAFSKNAVCEEVDAVFFDANQDGFKDLYVVSGGNELDSGSTALADHLYVNDGKGNFSENGVTLPLPLTNKSCVAVADIEHDGDADVFVGGLANSAQFGFPQDAFLLINNGAGQFTLANNNQINLHQLGIATSALFTDVNADGTDDLVVAGEWMAVKIFLNTKGNFEEVDIPASSGLWQSIYAIDINGDGKKDLLAGNWGYNSKLYSGKSGPLKLYVKDFDKNGSVEQVMAYTVAGKEYTFFAKDELERPLPVLKKAYLTYGEVAGETVQYMFYDLFKEYYETKAETLASSVFINDGKGGFSRQDLPRHLQLAPLFAFANMPDGKSFWAGGNFYGTVPYEGRYDGQLFSGTSYENGWKITGTLPALAGEMRAAKWITVKGAPHLLLARNNAPLLLLQPAKINK